MGKDNKQVNKKHRHKREVKEKKKRSKEEHLKRKNKDQEKKKADEFEATRYDLDDFAYKKLQKILENLIKHNEETKEAVPHLFNMLDKGNEVDLTNIEDGFVRENLEKIMDIFDKQIQKTEDNDGRFVYVKSGKQSLETQIKKHIGTMSNEAKREDWMTGMSDKLLNQYTPTPQTKITEDPIEQQRIQTYMQEYDK